MDMDGIYDEWKRGRLPVVNGIIHGDGTVDIIHVDLDPDNGYRRRISYGE